MASANSEDAAAAVQGLADSFQAGAEAADPVPATAAGGEQEAEDDSRSNKRKFDGSPEEHEAAKRPATNGLEPTVRIRLCSRPRTRSFHRLNKPLSVEASTSTNSMHPSSSVLPRPVALRACNAQLAAMPPVALPSVTLMLMYRR